MEVLDENYVPDTPEKKELFTLQQEYMYAVFEKTLLTDKGKSYVREHEKDSDAQSIYQKMKEHCLKSTSAAIESARILAYISSVQIDDGSWKGGAQSFILHWQNQVRLYETMVASSRHYTDDHKQAMLESAVHPLPELRDVKHRADQNLAAGINTTYEQYVDLLLSAAQSYDEEFKRENRHAHKRSVYVHKADDHYYGNNIDYDIDADVGILQAHATQHQPSSTHLPGSRLSGSQWHKLSSKAQAIWDQLDEKSKAIILARPSYQPSNKQHHENHHDPDKIIQAQLHDLEMGSNCTFEDQEQAIDPGPNSEEFHDAVEDHNAPDTLLAYITKRNELHPADL